MTMRLSLSRANVTPPEGERLTGVVVHSSNGRFRVTSRAGTELLSVEASAVRPISPGIFEVDTSAGVYSVERDKAGCGCRGSR